MAKYNFQNDKDREQCAKDFYKDIKMMAAKMSRNLGYDAKELELVCAESLVLSMNEFSNQKFIDKVLKNNPDISEEDAAELADSKNDFAKWARTRMRIACQNFADDLGRIVRLPVNQIRDKMKQAQITGDFEAGSTAGAYAGLNDRLSLDQLIANSHKELDDDSNLGAPSDDGDYDGETAGEFIDADGDRGKDASDVLDELVAELKAKHRERGAEDKIDIYKQVVMNKLLAGTPDEKKLGDIAKSVGKSAAYISAIQKDFANDAAEFFQNRGLSVKRK